MVRLIVKILRRLALFPVFTVLGGCDMVLMNPSGDVAVQQRNLILASTGLMLLIIVPVITFTVIFAWRYRASNTEAAYDPEWHHSTQLEVLIWTAPLLIIIALGALTWISTHVLDPFRPLGRIDQARAVPIDAQPLRVEVVALDWKWLFFYPDQGIATVNELAAPVDVPISFQLTSATVMNSFFIPALSGQVYAMAGMETKLHAVINREGVFNGLSSNYSGAGFSHMNFKFHALKAADFDAWVAKAKAQGTALDKASFAEIEKPSEAAPVAYYASVVPGLYENILNLCTKPGKMCLDEMMTIDAAGGREGDSVATRARLKYDGARSKEGNEAPGATFPASGRPPNTNVQPQGMKPRALSPDVNGQKTQRDDGQGHEMPMGGMEAMPGMKRDIAPPQLNQN